MPITESKVSLPTQNPGVRSIILTMSICNIIFILIYFLISYHSGYIANMPTILFSSPDSQGYRLASDWLFGIGGQTAILQGKPLLYPILLGIKNIAGLWSIWIIQVLLLFISANLIAVLLFRLFQKKIYIFLSFLLIAGNPSLFFLTFHALADIMALFLLTVWIFYFTMYLRSRYPYMLVILFFIAGLLVILKPIFQVFAAIVGIVFLVKSWKEKKNRALTWAALAIAILPVLAQLLFMYSTFGFLSNSNTSKNTIRFYFLPKLYAGEQGICLKTDAHEQIQKIRVITDTWDQEKILRYFLSHLPKALIMFHDNIVKENMQEGVVSSPKAIYYYATKTFNIMMYYIHIMFIPLCGGIFLLNRSNSTLRFFVFTLFFILFTYFLETGIAFWQGDRYIAVIIPIWLVLYITVFESFRKYQFVTADTELFKF